MNRVAVIGAGASGYFAAIHAAAQGCVVTILEKTSKSLSKVKVSGGGRCNVTHAAFENRLLVKNYPRGEKFLKVSFEKFSVKNTIDWFESRGVKLKIEQDGRMFPVSDDSESIIKALEKEASKLHVIIKYQFSVASIEKNEGCFKIKSSQNEELHFDQIIVCTGGSPKLQGFDFLSKLGHKINPPIPSLFTFNTPHDPIKSLMGISVPDAFVKLEGTKLSYQGPLLITHWGISGPAVLKLSAFGARWLADTSYKAKAHIRWVSNWTEESLHTDLNSFKSKHPKKKISSNPLFGLPSRLWEHFVEKSEISIEEIWINISKKQLNRLIQNLFCYIVTIDGKTTFKEEFVTAGGVSLDEVNPNTLESKLVSGLYFAGEVLDIDGITGGFNFQAAWTTGYIAGTYISNKG
ncbi:NAD(P)/FAD-dependent oxidoreductase [Belliella kenyensis]|uniref:NAD(P)/FAD-dependent oxidoreductase n=1 Tax=Belliella kenyensis TaxID=1472724 RepID=A0ABV8EM63_9BACT|nr:NAD(P)/FAD-dependent oxidoreductase [Belliella kenyensis]MCH7400401.1 NAD(P)/FAD-dependent oxidoreductase [Belliella kenyensis]MDN3604581.1 NAD(P)/FAD-dependent oxidoreductase [Belliella kenyensis]